MVIITELGLSGVPVVGDDDRVIGVVSEADLLPKVRRMGSAAAGRRASRKADARTPGS